MSSRAITFGTIWRATAVIFFCIVICFSSIATPSPSGEVAGAIVTCFAMIALGAYLHRAIKASDRKERFAISSIMANLGFAAMSLALIVTDPGLWKGQIHVSAYVAAFNTVAFYFFAWRRHQAWADGSYHKRFEPKAKLPSPFAVLKDLKR